MQTGLSASRHLAGSPVLRRGLRIKITTDASPYGLGAVLSVDKEIVSHLASPLTPTDREVLGLPTTPSSSDQQAAEALASVSYELCKVHVSMWGSVSSL